MIACVALGVVVLLLWCCCGLQAAGEVYEGALKYQRLVPWARVLALDAWVTSEQRTALHTQVLPQLLS